MGLAFIQIGEQKYDLTQSLKGYWLFMRMEAESKIIGEDIKALAELFCMLKVANPDTFRLTFSEFIDCIDEDPRILDQYIHWIKNRLKEILIILN